eukprot:gene22176-28712_t
MSVFITVGTTEFDALIEVCDNNRESFVEQLIRLGIRKITLQIGRGLKEPKQLEECCSMHEVEFHCFRFKDNLDQEMDEADLIISHCGAGSILEAVSRKKTLLVIINESLQDNHQNELSRAIVAGGYAVSATPEKLLSSLTTLHLQEQWSKRRVNDFKTFPIHDSKLFPKIVESLFDFI